MQRYNPSSSLKPRIFGMTATPRVDSAVRFHSFCVCPKEDVALYAANAPLTLEQYLPRRIDEGCEAAEAALLSLLRDLRATCPALADMPCRCRLEGCLLTGREFGMWCALR